MPPYSEQLFFILISRAFDYKMPHTSENARQEGESITAFLGECGEPCKIARDDENDTEVTNSKTQSQPDTT